MVCHLSSLEKAFAYRQWWLAANVSMAFWLTGLWKASSVFSRRCHYELSLHCHTVHRHPRPGLGMELTVKDLACKFSSAFFLKGGMTESQEILNINVAWILQLRWVSYVHKSRCWRRALILWEKRRGLTIWNSIQNPHKQWCKCNPILQLLYWNLWFYFPFFH